MTLLRQVKSYKLTGGLTKQINSSQFYIQRIFREFKGTVSVIPSDLICKDGNV